MKTSVFFLVALEPENVVDATVHSQALDRNTCRQQSEITGKEPGIQPTAVLAVKCSSRQRSLRMFILPAVCHVLAPLLTAIAMQCN